MPDTRKTIFITGGASGIGRAAARLFAAKGWFVGCYDLKAAGLLAPVAVRDQQIAGKMI